MGNDLPDYQTEVVSSTTQATSFRYGLDAAKPATPAAGDIWLAVDTRYLYVCFTAGSWESVAKLYLPLAGGTMSGAIAMGTNKVTGLAAPTNNADAARKLDVDTVDAKLDDISGGTDLSGSQVVDTNYQNGTKIRLVLISFEMNADGYGSAKTDSASPPTTIVARQQFNSAIAGYSSLMFLVQPSHYYRFEDIGATATIDKWIEWTLF